MGEDQGALNERVYNRRLSLDGYSCNTYVCMALVSSFAGFNTQEKRDVRLDTQLDRNLFLFVFDNFLPSHFERFLDMFDMLPIHVLCPYIFFPLS